MSINYIRSLDCINNIEPNTEQFHLPINEIYIGVLATESITALKLNNSICSSEINKFLKSCQEFYIELIVDIKKRFVFDDCVSVTDPIIIKEFKIKSLSFVITRFPILNEYISSIQDLDREWRQPALMDIPLTNDSNNVLEYWRIVFLMKNGVGETYFPNIVIMMRLLLVLPFSNASVERVFSDMKNVKTLHRNKLKTDTLVGILRTKDSIEDCISFKPTSEMVKSKIWD